MFGRRRSRRGESRTTICTHKYLQLSVIVAISITLLIVFCFEFFPGYTIDQSYAHVNSVEKKPEIIRVETICTPSRLFCCSVVDVIMRGDAWESVRRMMYFNKFKEDFESEVLLVPPAGMTSENSDTRLWKVDHSQIFNEYIVGMILFPFIVGTLNDSDDISRPQSVLVIGLGGGSLDMFLHTRFPSINITVVERESTVKDLAHKWFGVVDDDTRKTVLMDGVEAVQKEALRGELYDVVVVDACDSRISRMPCPASDFLTPTFLNNVKYALKPMGSFVLNVLPLMDEDNNLKIVRMKLLRVFKSCMSMRMVNQMNSVFACVSYSIHQENLEASRIILEEKKTKIWFRIYIK